MQGEYKVSNTLKEPLIELEASNYTLKEGNTSFSKSIFNCLNSMTGFSILSVPYALASGGWLSLVLLFAIAMSATYTGLLVKRCMETDRSIKTYGDIGRHAFGRIGELTVSIILYADLYMVVTGFLILEGDNLHNLFPEITVQIFGVSIDGKTSFIILVALVLLPTVLLDDLSILAYFSAGGVLTSIVILASVFWVGAFDGIGFQSKGVLLNWKGIPASLSLFMFCCGGHPVFPSLYNSMDKKQHFSKVLLICFSICSMYYVVIAIVGYLMFGHGVKSQITLNLPVEKLSSQIAIYTTLVIPLVKYALMLKPVVISTESWFPTYRKKKKLFRVSIRTFLVCTQVIVALTLPFFGYLMSLVGALLTASASLIIPCLCYLKISRTKFGVEMAFIFAILMFSAVIVIFGTYDSLVQIIHKLVDS